MLAYTIDRITFQCFPLGIGETEGLLLLKQFPHACQEEARALQTAPLPSRSSLARTRALTPSPLSMEQQVFAEHALPDKSVTPTHHKSSDWMFLIVSCQGIELI